ncbi:MAG: N-6 DNA methylase, partial [Deltaproteobacteria bacterium]|nr:N-6 DNA methylase [Deltaproteobacteria bacterium]
MASNGSTPSLRHQLGQWFTPPELADLVVALATDKRPGLDIVDPTCGDGVFLERARLAGGKRLRGLDIDPHAVAGARGRVEGAEISCGSLFSIEPEQWMADAVIGNPPYVRQERLENHTRSDGQRCLEADWNGVADKLVALGKRADLSALCISRMLRLVKPGGRLGLVVSSALFDAGYARALWRGLEQVAAVVAIVESPDERWFSDAAVNAVVIVLERGKEPAPFPVARLRVPIEEARAVVKGLDDLAKVAEIRTAEPGRSETWASLLRAPSAWFEFERVCGDALVPLSEIASIKRGMTSGANDVFYMSRTKAEELALEPEVLAPLVRSPREASAESIVIEPDGTPSVALVVPDVEDARQRYPIAWQYLMSYSEAAERPTLRARSPWWSLPATASRVFLTKAYGARFIQRLSPIPVVADQRVYALTPKHGIDPTLLAAVLNSTYT